MFHFLLKRFGCQNALPYLVDLQAFLDGLIVQGKADLLEDMGPGFCEQRVEIHDASFVRTWRLFT